MFGVHPAIPGFALCGRALWFLGRADQARALAVRGLAYAEESHHPFSLASWLVHSAIFELVCENWETAADLAARAAEISAINGFSHFSALSRFLGAVALAEQGDLEHGLPEMLAGLVDHRSVTGRHVSGLMLGFIAAALARAGRRSEALQKVEEGIALADATSECFYAAELWRVKGEILLGKVPTAETKRAARKCFRRSLEVARQQEAMALALRTAMSLTRLSRGRGRNSEDRDILRTIYTSFTEGFDTRDLREAKALLDQGATS
jgi:predicted ATPase